MAAPERRVLAFRWAAWLCVASIAYLSLIPQSLQVRTSAPAGVEHALAYAATAWLMVLAYRSQPVLAIAGMLAAYSGLMELLQTVSPGRHPGIDGALWSSAGAALGAWGGANVCAHVQQMRRLVEKPRGISSDDRQGERGR
jgi:VanZ family protein